MFDRSGGVSLSPYNSANLSYRVGDKPENVRQNRDRVKQLLGIDTLVSAHQIHADRILHVDGCRKDTEFEGYDALITDNTGVGLLIQQADCQAVLLHDPVHRAIAAIHCGWRGSVLNIVAKTIQQMGLVFRTNPAEIRAAVSPSMGLCCGEFIHYRQELPETMHSMRTEKNHFDFWEITALQLQEAGVPKNRIDVAGICTVCNTAYFSYRRSKGKGRETTGRQGTVIMLHP